MTAQAAPVQAAHWVAPVSWRVIDFISDLHLSEHTPKGFAAWSNYLTTTPADCVVILGDLFEAWVGDDAMHAGFEGRCAAVLLAAAQHRKIAFMPGNRDFLVDTQLLESCGVIPLHDPTLLISGSQRLLLTHGDALCLADTEYQQFRATVRGPQWRSAFLAQPLPLRREQAADMRAQSQARQREQGPEHWADVDLEAALAWLKAAGADTMIHGHTHRPARHALTPGKERYVLSDWDLDHAQEPRADLLRLDDGRLSRISPLAPA